MAKELPISVGTSEYCSRRLSLRNRKRQFNGFEYFESMHLLAQSLQMKIRFGSIAYVSARNS
jgi:hypothetical protein